MIFSVVLPTYNRADLLLRAVESVLNQTFQDFELLIIDDNSTDNTSEVVNSINDPRIVYIKHDSNKGPAGARNTGIKHSKAEYIAFQDSDDEWVPGKLQRFYSKLANSSPDYGMAYSKMIRIAPNNKRNFFPPSWLSKKEGVICQELLKRNFLDTPASIVKRECFNRVGLFDESFSCLEDYDLFLRIAKFYKVIYIDEPLLFSYTTSGGVNSADYSIHAEVHEKILNKYIGDYSKDNKLLSGKYAAIADFYSTDKKYKEARLFFKKAIAVRKYNVISYILFLITILDQYIIKGSYRFCRRLLLKIMLIVNKRPELF